MSTIPMRQPDWSPCTCIRIRSILWTLPHSKLVLGHEAHGSERGVVLPYLPVEVVRRPDVQLFLVGVLLVRFKWKDVLSDTSCRSQGLVEIKTKVELSTKMKLLIWRQLNLRNNLICHLIFPFEKNSQHFEDVINGWPLGKILFLQECHELFKLCLSKAHKEVESFHAY